MADQLLRWDTELLLDEACRIRDKQFGNIITFSPKVFIPLTRLCRDSCGYCTFAEPPARVDAPFLNAEHVVSIAHAGRVNGCTEALFTLGERPELRYDIARTWLAARGYETTVHYLRDMCALVRDETGLLPHANAGALDRAELCALRPVTASQGMMLESLRPDLDAHRLAPDKVPERRLHTLDAAGELSIPFTTGILIGIGEDPDDWVIALEAIASAHRRYGHIAEVIVQNFQPKADTGMRMWPAPSIDTHLRAVAIARIILPEEIHLQAPPNLTEDFGRLLHAGIDDWGGVSPVTPDHVNPEKPWPVIDRLAEVAAKEGFQLRPRLPIYDGFHQDRWIDLSMRPYVDALRARLVAT